MSWIPRIILAKRGGDGKKVLLVVWFRKTYRFDFWR